jgi:hypothetical protein
MVFLRICYTMVHPVPIQEQLKLKYLWIVDEAIGIVQRAIGNVVFGGL